MKAFCAVLEDIYGNSPPRDKGRALNAAKRVCAQLRDVIDLSQDTLNIPCTVTYGDKVVDWSSLKDLKTLSCMESDRERDTNIQCYGARVFMLLAIRGGVWNSSTLELTIPGQDVHKRLNYSVDTPVKAHGFCTDIFDLDGAKDYAAVVNHALVLRCAWDDGHENAIDVILSTLRRLFRLSNPRATLPDGIKPAGNPPTSFKVAHDALELWAQQKPLLKKVVEHIERNGTAATRDFDSLVESFQTLYNIPNADKVLFSELANRKLATSKELTTETVSWETIANETSEVYGHRTRLGRLLERASRFSSIINMVNIIHAALVLVQSNLATTEDAPPQAPPDMSASPRGGHATSASSSSGEHPDSPSTSTTYDAPSPATQQTSKTKSSFNATEAIDPQTKGSQKSSTSMTDKEIQQLVVLMDASFEEMNQANDAAVAGGWLPPELQHKDKKQLYKMIADLLKRNKNPNMVRTESKRSLLHAVCASPYFANLVSGLLENGADVNNADSSGATPLHTAVANKNTKAAAILLKNKANVDVQTNDGMTPLMIVCETHTDADIIRILDVYKTANVSVDSVTSLGHTPLLRCCWLGKWNIAKRLLDHMPIPNVNHRDDLGLTPITAIIVHSLLASLGGEATSLFRKMVSMGAQLFATRTHTDRDDDENIYIRPQQRTSSAIIPLHLACMFDNALPLVHIMLSKMTLPGDDPIMKRAVMICCMERTLDSLDLLLRNGADATYRNDNGDTTIKCVLSDPSERSIPEFLSAMETPDGQRRYGNTRITQAMQKQRLTQPHQIALAGFVDDLISNGVDVDSTNMDDDTTALMQACLNGMGGITHLLVESNADVNLTDSGGRNALWYACEVACNSCIRAILTTHPHTTRIDKHRDIIERAMRAPQSDYFNEEASEVVHGQDEIHYYEDNILVRVEYKPTHPTWAHAVHHYENGILVARECLAGFRPAHIANTISYYDENGKRTHVETLPGHPRQGEIIYFDENSEIARIEFKPDHPNANTIIHYKNGRETHRELKR